VAASLGALRSHEFESKRLGPLGLGDAGCACADANAESLEAAHPLLLDLAEVRREHRRPDFSNHRKLRL